jgi:elongation factor 1-beta
MPTSPETDLAKIEQQAKEEITAFTDTDTFKVEQKPIAFGLKSVNITFTMDENKGSTDELEEKIATLNGVNSVEVTDVRRAIG